VSAIEFFEITAVATAGATLQGSLGFGLGVFAVPLFFFIDPALVPGPTLAAAMILTATLAYRERHAVHIADIKWAIIGRVFGVAAALVVLTLVPPRHLATLLGALILAAVAITASGVHLPPKPATLVSAGLVSGFMGTSVSVGGPPLALVYQRESGPRVRGTLSTYFVIGAAISLIGLHFVHRFGLHQLLLAGALAPGVIVGYLISRRLAPILDRGYTRIGVLTVSGVMGAIVILKQVL